MRRKVEKSSSWFVGYYDVMEKVVGIVCGPRTSWSSCSLLDALTELQNLRRAKKEKMQEKRKKEKKC